MIKPGEGVLCSAATCEEGLRQAIGPDAMKRLGAKVAPFVDDAVRFGADTSIHQEHSRTGGRGA